MKTGFLKKFLGKRLWRTLFSIKILGHIYKDMCFPVRFWKFLGTTFLQNNSWRMILNFQYS